MKRVLLALGILAAITALSCAVVGVFFWLPAQLWGETGMQWGLVAYFVIAIGAGTYSISDSITE